MKTTIDLPDDLLQRTKIAAAENGSTVMNLVIEGLEAVLNKGDKSGGATSAQALRRLKAGFRLGGASLNRDEAHAR